MALQTSWSAATAAWGPAWDAHVYGVGCLFALLGLLGLLVLLAGPRGRPPAARLLGGLLAVAGAARAFPLFFDAYERRGRLPPPAARLLFELPFPCLGWGLALALCLPRPPRRCRTPAVAALGVLHAGGVLGAVLAVAALGRLPGLLLLPRGLFAGLAAALTLWVLPRCGAGSRGVPRGKGGAGGGPGGAAAAVGVAAAGAVLSAGLQVFGALQALGWGGPAPPGPWAWWGLQLGCRLAEAAMGLPLAVLALVAAPPPRHARPLDPPNGCAPRPRGEAEALPLCGSPPEPPEADGDPTAGFRPPSPIDLRRSIDEALGARPGIFRHGAGTAAGISVIGTARTGTNGAAGSGGTGVHGIGPTSLPGIGTTGAAGLGATTTPGPGTASTARISTTATPSLGTTGTGALSTPSITGLGTTGTPGLDAAGTAGISTTSASGLGTTAAPSLGTTSTSGLGTTSTLELSTASTPELSTTSTPSLGAASTPGLGKTAMPALGTTGAAGFGTTTALGLGTTATPNLGTTGTSEPNATGTQGLGATATPDLSTTGTPEPGTAGPPPPPAPSTLQRAASCGGVSAASPGVRGRRCSGGGGSPSTQGLSRRGPAAVPDPSPPPQGTPQAAPTLRPSQSWAGGSPHPLPVPRSQGGQAVGGVPAAGGVPEAPGEPGADRRSQCSDTIDL